MALPRPLALLVAFALALPAASGAGAQEGAPAAGAPSPGALVEPPPAIVTRGVPAVEAAAVAGLLPYENLRAAQFEDWHPGERRMLIGTRFAESRQLHEVARPLGSRSQLTFFRDPVGTGLYRPGRPAEIAYLRDEGGDEDFQVYLLDRATGTSRSLTDGVARHQSLHWSPDGRLLAYTGNARTGRDSDLYVHAPEGGGERRVAELEGAWGIADWSADGRRILLVKLLSAAETRLHAAEVETGMVRPLTPEGEPPAAYAGGTWSRDGASVYTVTDRGGEFRRLARLDLESGLWTVLSPGIDWDVEAFDLSEDGALLAFFTNEDGVSRLHLLATATGAERPAPELPAGVASAPRFRPGSHELAFGLSWARSPQDVYTYDADSARLERWTESEVGGLDPAAFRLPELVRFPTFDRLPGPSPREPGPPRTIPAFVYRPDPARHPGARPVYVGIHGGPESQWRPRFLGSDNFLLEELGVALVYPNVRGSTGYGRTYHSLDNGRLREDSVRDIGALLDWLGAQADLDASRVMVGGGSYGGFMVLASLAAHGDRLAAGYDSVGISNFVTFLTHTEDYRRDLRRAEYGDERDPEMRRFLEQISPLNRVERMARPLLVAQGANDPRVPASESEQMVAALERQGTPVWYVVAQDEGHGFRKKSNSDYLREVWVEFVRRYLLRAGPSALREAPVPAPDSGW
jgi:dipeptidyl aminopeptidase/acylaminoacyl peptidase